MAKAGKQFFQIPSLRILCGVLLLALMQRVWADRTGSFDRLFPPDALVYCSIPNLHKFHVAWQASPLAALVKDQVLREALTKAGVDRWIRSQIPFAQRVNIPSGEIAQIFSQRMAVALVSTNPSPASLKNIHLLVVADYKGSQADVESLIHKCLSGLKEVSRKRSAVNGVTVYSCNYVLTEPVSIPEVSSKGGNSTRFSASVPAESASSPAAVLKEYIYRVAYAFHDSVFICGLGADGGVKAVLRNRLSSSTSSLTQKDTYQTLASESRKSADIFFYINAGLCLQLLENEAGSQRGTTESGGLNLLSPGLSELQAAGIWVELKPQGLDIVREILLSRRESGLAEILFPQMGNSFKSLRLTPADVIAYKSSVWDCAAWWLSVKNVLRESWPEAFARLSEIEQSLNGQFGFPLEQELFGVVKGERAQYLRRGSDQGRPLYSRTYIIDVSDAEKVQLCVEKMLESVKSLGLIQYQRDTYLGQTVFVVRPFNVAGSTRQWGLVCLPSFCVASSSAGEVRKLIRRIHADAGLSLAENAEIQDVLSRYPRNVSRLSYRVYGLQVQSLRSTLAWLKPVLPKTAASVIQVFELAYIVKHQVLPRYLRKIISLWTVTGTSARGETSIFYRAQ